LSGEGCRKAAKGKEADSAGEKRSDVHRGTPILCAQPRAVKKMNRPT
jgi:hypothetical protein